MDYYIKVLHQLTKLNIGALKFFEALLKKQPNLGYADVKLVFQRLHCAGSARRLSLCEYYDLCGSNPMKYRLYFLKCLTELGCDVKIESRAFSLPSSIEWNPCRVFSSETFAKTFFPILTFFSLSSKLGSWPRKEFFV